LVDLWRVVDDECEMKTLIVQGDQPDRDALRASLEHRGHEVTVCADEDGAWRAWQVHRHQVVVMEEVPAGTAFALCRRIRAHPQGFIPVIFAVSTAGDPGALERAVSAGADAFHLGPLRDEGLDTRLDILERRARASATERLRLSLLRPASAGDGTGRTLGEGLSAATGDAFFRTLALYLARTLETAHAFVGMRAESDAGSLRTLALVVDGEVAPSEVLPIPGSPLEGMMRGEVFARPSGIRGAFPGDAFLERLGAEGYVGVLLTDSRSEPIGVVAVAHRGWIGSTEMAGSLMRTFAARAASEMERMRTEDALRASEARYRALAESASVGIWQITPQGRTVYANERMLALLEVDAVCELEGRTHREFVAPECHARMDREHAMRREGIASSYEVVLVGSRGGRRDVVISGAPLLDDQGRLVGLIGTFADVTELRSLERHATQAERLRELQTLAGGIAHDFNNVLTEILGNASMAAKRANPDPALRDSLGRIEAAAERAASLTGQLLACAGTGAMRTERVEMGDVVQTCARRIAGRVGPGMLRLPATLDVVVVPGDRSQLERMVDNLLANAVDAMVGHDGTIGLRLGTLDADAHALAEEHPSATLQPGRYAVVEVEDAGAGMDAATRERAFQPFFSTKAPGRGLGLAAVLGIARAHGGAVRLHDRPGGGTVARVFLRAADEAPPSPPRTETPPAGALVLVVDDEDGIRTVGRFALEEAGFRVLTAPDGLAGVDLVRAHRDEVAAVVLDMTMPRMNGDEAFRQMRRLRPDLPIILCSGYGEQQVIGALVAEGLTAFVPKPFRPAALVEQVRAGVSART
jgi:PAS domain S-box-containing protein